MGFVTGFIIGNMARNSYTPTPRNETQELIDSIECDKTIKCKYQLLWVFSPIIVLITLFCVGSLIASVICILKRKGINRESSVVMSSNKVQQQIQPDQENVLTQKINCCVCGIEITGEDGANMCNKCCGEIYLA